jgi:transposase-like protein
MTIVHLGSVLLQIEQEATRQTFFEKLKVQLQDIVNTVIARCIEEALEAEVTLLLRRGWYERRRAEDRQRTRATCKQCGSEYARDFRRDGHYKRYLDTSWGRIRIWVPQLECVCGGQVTVQYQTIRRGQRIWDDLEEGIRERSGWGMTLRQSKAQMDVQLGSSVGLRTLNERIHQMSKLVPGWRQDVLEEIPPVVRVDGIWLTLMKDTEEKKKDALGRQRTVKQRHKVPILVAQGIWPTSGKQAIVAWVVGEAEDETSWEALLSQMVDHGICPQRGLRLLVVDGAAGFEPARQTVFWDVPVQRCIFHKLRNICRDLVVPEDLSRKQKRALRRRFARSVARIWQAENEPEASKRQNQFCTKWQDKQPKAVATLRRDFQTTLTFYRLQAQAERHNQHWPARYLRTTSHLERDMRTLRRRLSPAVLFHSIPGLEAVIHQYVLRRTAERAKALPGSWQRTLEHALGALEAIS